MLPRLCLTLCGALLALPAFAHEFWIAPERYQLDAGETLQADFKNGEEFAGATLSYFERSSERFLMTAAGKEWEITPRSGDSPALSVVAPVADGLVVVVHETTPARLTYRKWEKFLKFAAHKDFPNAAAYHAAAGWSQERFRESYTRHVKALFTVGTGAGQDRAIGLATEFIALTNPYARDFEGNMGVSLLLEGQARPDAQIEVFARAPDGKVAISLHRTNAEGIAIVPVQPNHEYLFDAVTLRPFTGEGEQDDPNTPVWETLWAALTFKVPQ